MQNIRKQKEDDSAHHHHHHHHDHHHHRTVIVYKFNADQHNRNSTENAIKGEEKKEASKYRLKFEIYHTQNVSTPGTKVKISKTLKYLIKFLFIQPLRFTFTYVEMKLEQQERKKSDVSVCQKIKKTWKQITKNRKRTCNKCETFLILK